MNRHRLRISACWVIIKLALALVVGDSRFLQRRVIDPLVDLYGDLRQLVR